MHAPGKGKEEKMEDRRKYCQVCFHAFTNTDRRPRFISCGHTFCTKCISDNLQQNILLCPFCRKEHQAASPTDFPIIYDLEDFLFEEASLEPAPSEIPSPECDPPKTISKKLTCVRAELTASAQSMKGRSEEVRSQLQQYQTFMKEWEGSLLKLSETFSTISQQLKDMATTIGKESVRLSDAMEEKEEEQVNMEIAKEKLHEAKSNQEVLQAIEETTLSYDALDLWIQEVQTNYPNEKLVRKAMMLQATAHAALEAVTTFAEMASTADETAEVQSDPNIPYQDLEASSPPDMNILSAHSDRGHESSSSSPMPSVEKKLKEALEWSSSLPRPISLSRKDNQEKGVQTEQLIEMTDLRERNEDVLRLIKHGKVYAEQKKGGRRRYARMTLDEENRICLHHLSDKRLLLLPHDAHLLQHDDVMSVVNSSSPQRAFLELGADKESLGRIVINLNTKFKRAENFSALCSGQFGPSYVTTRILDVMWKDQKGETVRCGDYKFNDGRGGQEVIPGAGEEWRGEWVGPWVAGSVGGWYRRSAIASQFGFVTEDHPDWKLGAVFGTVETGLNVVKNVVSRYSTIRKVKIINCGVILPL